MDRQKSKMKDIILKMLLGKTGMKLREVIVSVSTLSHIVSIALSCARVQAR